MNYLSIDTEYSSFFSAKEGKSGELLQLAIVPVINGVMEEPFNEYCRPLTSVWNSEAEKVHKISRKMSMEQQHPSELASKLKLFLLKYDTMFFALGHNPSGDQKYIERLIRDYSMINDWHRRVKTNWKCTRDIASKMKSKITTKDYKLETLCNFLRVPLDAHDALSDAIATSKVYELMNNMESASRGIQPSISKESELDKIKKYMDIKYVMFNGEGSVYLSEHATSDREALRIVLNEIWSKFGEV